MDRRKARDRRHRRVRKKVRGTAERPRLVVFKSNRYIYAQVVDDDSGRTLASASSLEKALRAKSLSRETATEVGKLVVQRAKGAGVEQVVFDRGGYPYHGRVQALAEAVREAGVRF
jgi:large subunit ribosomal protein L18